MSKAGSREASLLNFIVFLCSSVCQGPETTGSFKKCAGSRWGREVGLAGVGWRDGEKMQTIVME